MKPPRTLDADTPAAVRNHLEQLNKVVGGNVSFGTTFGTDDDQNIEVFKINTTSPVAPNTDFTFTHTLGRVPLMMLSWMTNNGGVIYTSPATLWTSTTVTLRCTTASANCWIFLV